MVFLSLLTSYQKPDIDTIVSIEVEITAELLSQYNEFTREWLETTQNKRLCWQHVFSKAITFENPYCVLFLLSINSVDINEYPNTWSSSDNYLEVSYKSGKTERFNKLTLSRERTEVEGFSNLTDLLAHLRRSHFHLSIDEKFALSIYDLKKALPEADIEMLEEALNLIKLVSFDYFSKEERLIVFKQIVEDSLSNADFESSTLTDLLGEDALRVMVKEDEVNYFKFLLNEYKLKVKKSRDSTEELNVSLFKRMLEEHSDTVTNETNATDVKNWVRNNPKYKLVALPERRLALIEDFLRRKRNKVSADEQLYTLIKDRFTKEISWEEVQNIVNDSQVKELNLTVEQIKETFGQWMRTLRNKHIEEYKQLLVEKLGYNTEVNWYDAQVKLQKDVRFKQVLPAQREALFREHYEKSKEVIDEDFEKMLKEHTEITKDTSIEGGDFRVLLSKLNVID